MKIGIFTVSIPDYTPEEAIRIASELGYDGLEWRIVNDTGDREHPSFWGGNRTSMTPAVLTERAPELKKLASDAKLEMPTLGSYVNCSNLNAVEEVLAAASVLGAKGARVGTAGYDPAKPWREQMDFMRTQYKEVEKLARKYGVRAMIETHMGLLTPTVVTARMVLEGLDPACVGIMWDPGNQLQEGRERYDMAIDIAGEYLAEVHVKNTMLEAVNNNGNEVEWVWKAAPSRLGAVNWPQVVAELKKASWDGWMMFEDFSTVVPLRERIEGNLKYLRGLL